MLKTLFLTLLTAFTLFSIGAQADNDCSNYGAKDLGSNIEMGQTVVPVVSVVHG
jgi:hypothetical protein